MDFDPLSLFTPRQYAEPEAVVVAGGESPDVSFEEDVLVPLHWLDLPMLKLKPLFEALYTVLRLLALEEVLNFSSQAANKTQDVFLDRQLSEETVNTALKWLEINCSRLDSREKLQYVPQLAPDLKQMREYNDWLTRIVANNLLWMSSEQKTKVIKEVSLRLAENCGRTAQPEITRKIVLENMRNLKVDYIRLKEPSLTNDNLGLKTWGSSLILGQKLVNRELELKEPILELGSGTGLVGFITLLLGHKNVYLTDLPAIVPNLKENLIINNLTCVVDELDWTDPKPFLEKYGQIDYGTIILSDPLYSPEHPRLISNVLEQFASPQTTILIQLPIRRNYEVERQNLWDLLNKFFKEVDSCTEVGDDEFGAIGYCFKRFERL